MMEFYMTLLVVLLPISNIGRCSAVQISKKSVVVVFEPDRVASVASFMRFLGDVPEMRQVSGCFRLNMEQIRPGVPIISYSTPNYDNELLFFITFKSRINYEIYCCDSSFKLSNEINTGLLDWNSFCVTLDLISKEYSLFMNGLSIVKKETININITDPKVSGGGILYIGQEQDTYGKTFNPFQTIRGKVADLYLTSSILSEIEMIYFTTCRTNFINSINLLFDFQDISKYFELSEVQSYNTSDLESLCKKSIRRKVILTEPRTAGDAIKICKTIGGSLAAPKNSEDNAELFDISSKFSKQCLTSNTDILWLGVHFHAVKKKLVYIDSHEVVQYQNPWGDYVANSEDACISFHGVLEDSPSYYGKWDATTCDSDKCSPCEFQKAELLKLRGLCTRSFFDREYFVIQDNGSAVFLGNKYSAIFKVASVNISLNDFGYWEIKRFDMPKVKATMRMEYLSHYPIGRNSWEIANDRCGVIKGDLVLTVCKSGQFSCADGSCIALRQRCNLEIDCPDGTDEDDCTPLILPTKYSSKISPPHEDPNVPIQIHVYIEIYAIRSFELTAFKFVTEANVTTMWSDTRIRFKALKKATNLNNVETGDKMPWIPAFEFLGGGNMTSDVQERSVSLFAGRRTEPLDDDDQNFREDEIYLGEGIALVMEKKITLSTSCIFELGYFPFDVQSCFIIMLMSDTTINYAEFSLNKDSVHYVGERKLLEYYVISVTNQTYSQDLFSGVMITMKFQNLYLYYMTSAFIPTLIMMVIGVSCFFFPIEDFNDRIMVSLTSLLVEATLFSQVSSSIPKTAYLKFIDIWFVFCIMKLFSVNVCLTAVNYLYRKTDHNNLYTKLLKKARIISPKSKMTILPKGETRRDSRESAIRGNKALQIAFPTILIIFVTVYAGIAFFHT